MKWHNKDPGWKIWCPGPWPMLALFLMHGRHRNDAVAYLNPYFASEREVAVRSQVSDDVERVLGREDFSGQTEGVPRGQGYQHKQAECPHHVKSSVSLQKPSTCPTFTFFNCLHNHLISLALRTPKAYHNCSQSVPKIPHLYCLSI